ncbi:TonB-dependent siderophore receptor [Massilia scottii]|uniref:TonB-dependent siderophore receptor n=1 Tax=Massilia scottii TaxID=3057166 RepID=UPI0027969C0C|nr:TonB-dependent siderophore receptor [Massilia sp. CCM 9029]MDQ1833525.1 TonB-dependent siderophore receptor [Massilia sp. CCM 9029]
MAHHAPFGPAHAGAAHCIPLPLTAAVRSALIFAALAGQGALAFASEVADEAVAMPVITVDGNREDNGYVAKRSGAGTKTDTPLIETPQSISVIPRERFEEQGAQTLRQTLNYSAGLVSSYFDSRVDSVTSRGGNPAMLQDGVQSNFGSYNTTRPDPYTLERVEVLRGPSSVLYGQGGIGGVVNLVSKRPMATSQREVQVQIGSNSRKQLSLDINQVLDDDGHWLARLVAVGRDSGTQVNMVDDDRKLLAPSLTWAPNANTSLTVLALRQEDHSGSMIGFFPWQATLLPSAFGQIPTSTFTGEPGWDAYDTEQTALGYLFSHRFNDTLSVRQTLRKTKSEVDYRSAYTSFTAVAATGRPARPVFNADQRTINRDLVQNLNNLETLLVDTQLEAKLATGPLQHTILLGADVQRVETRQANGRGVAAPLDVYAPVYGNYTVPKALTRLPTTNLRQNGYYMQDQIKYGPRWVTVLGLRHDGVTNDIEGRSAARTDDSANTRRVGLLYLADGGWSPYVSYAESFLPLGGVDLNGQAFRPQRGEQWEAGLKWQPPGRSLMTTLAVYDLRDTNRKTADPANPLNSIQIGEVHVRGLELESAGKLGRDWDWTAGYAYTDATVSRSNGADNGKRLSGIPKHNVSAWLTHRFSIAQQDGFSAGAGVRYLGSSMDGLDQLETPDITLLDAMLSYSSGPLRVALNVTNLTDKVQISTCLARGDCFYGQRRAVALTARYTF